MHNDHIDSIYDDEFDDEEELEEGSPLRFEIGKALASAALCGAFACTVYHPQVQSPPFWILCLGVAAIWGDWSD